MTFDRPMQAATFTPGQVLQIMGPVCPISGPQNYPSSDTLQTIPAATASGSGVLTSTVSIPSFNGTFAVADITVQLNVAFTGDSSLSAVLIGPDGTQVTLFSGVGGSGSNFMNTTFDDSAEIPIASGNAPFSRFVHTGPAALGLRRQDRRHNQSGRSPASGSPATGRCKSPTPPAPRAPSRTRALNVTPVIWVAPVSPSTTINVQVPAATAAGPGVLNSGLTIPASPNPGAVDSSLSVHVGLTDPNNANLSARCWSLPTARRSICLPPERSPAQTSPARFSAIPAQPGKRGIRAVHGIFKPEDPRGLAQLIGENLAGTWTLRMTNTATGVVDTLVSWSLVTSKATYASEVATTFAISFPQQEFSGTYTVEIGPDAATVCSRWTRQATPSIRVWMRGCTCSAAAVRTAR